jgi:hypothetical protein
VASLKPVNSFRNSQIGGYQKTGTAVAFNGPCRDNTGEYQERPMRYFDGQDKARAKDTLHRVGEWLGRRPMESWGFFIAGFLLGSIFF